MKDANDTTIRTVPLLRAVEEKVRAIQWTSPGGADVPAFGRVEIYDMRDLEEAIRDLVTGDDRVAVITYDADNWETEAYGSHAKHSVVREFTILVTDRHRGRRIDALLGGDQNPGALHLGDIVVEELAGTLAVKTSDAAGAAKSRAWIEPVQGRPIAIDRDGFPGRVVKGVTFRIHAGVKMPTLSQSYT